MFVQMFTGKVTDAAAVRGVLEGWPTGAGRDAEGWLGSTAGITDDGQLVALARFESAGGGARQQRAPRAGPVVGVAGGEPRR